MTTARDRHDWHRAHFEAKRLRDQLDDLAERLVTQKWTRLRSLTLDGALDRWDRAVDQTRRGAA